MKEITLNGYTLGVCEVGKKATMIEVIKDYLLYFVGTNRNDVKQRRLPSNGYSLIGPGLASEIGEGDAKELVMNDHGDLFDYTGKNMFCATATASLHSFLRSQGYGDADKIVLLIKK